MAKELIGLNMLCQVDYMFDETIIEFFKKRDAQIKVWQKLDITHSSQMDKKEVKKWIKYRDNIFNKLDKNTNSYEFYKSLTYTLINEYYELTLWFKNAFNQGAETEWIISGKDITDFNKHIF